MNNISLVIATLKDSIVRLSGALGVDIAKHKPAGVLEGRTSPDALGKLIRSLHPFQTGAPLIRLGPDGDGGYLLPNDLEGIKYGFSPGVSTESGFEIDLANQGMQVYLADYSVPVVPQSHPNFEFDRKFVGAFSDEIFMTLDEWKKNKIPDYKGDLILQMDIEGMEYETLMQISMDLLAQFRIIVIEFHNLQALFRRTFFTLASNVFDRLLHTHSVVHIHPNNCCGFVKGSGFDIPRVAEFTFYRNDRFRRGMYQTMFPHPLDRDNTHKRSLPLPGCWYRQS